MKNEPKKECASPPTGPVWWLAFVKTDPTQALLVLSQSWFGARAQACIHLQDEPGALIVRQDVGPPIDRIVDSAAARPALLPEARTPSPKTRKRPARSAGGRAGKTNGAKTPKATTHPRRKKRR